MLLSRPYSNVPNTKNFQKFNLHFDKSLAEVIAEDLDGRTPLWHAISSADEVEVNRLLNADNILLDEQIGFGETPLSLAVKSENEEIVKLPLNTKRINVNQPNADDRMPLLLAVRKSNSAIVGLLLNTLKVNVVPENYNSQNLFLYAALMANQDHHTDNIFQAADYAAGHDCDWADFMAVDIVTKYPSCLILVQLRHYIHKNGLKIASYET